MSKNPTKSEILQALESKLSQDTLILLLPSEIYPLEEGAMDFWNKLFSEAIKKEHEGPSCIIVLQNPATSLHTKEWLKSLKENLLLSELCDRMGFIRRTIQIVSQSEKNIYFLSQASCFGWYFDLAMASQKIFSFNSESFFGFPEIPSGGFPCGGTLEKLSSSQKRQSDFWLRKCVFSAQEALELDWLDYVGDFWSWLENKKNFLLSKHQSRRQKVSDVQNSLEKQLIDSSEINASSEQLIKRDGGYVDFMFRSWDASWRVIQNSSKGPNSGNQEQLLLYFGARHYLSASYQIWCARDSWLFEPNKEPIRHLIERPVQDKVVCVVLSESMIPPARPLIRLLRRGYVIVFVAQQAEHQRANLELLFGRLERVVPLVEAQKLWRERVCWILSDQLPPEKNIRLMWNGDDQLLIFQSHSSAFVFQRIEGNKGNASSGWCEFSTSDLNQSISHRVLELVNAMSNGVIPCKPVGIEMIPMTLFIRSAILELLLNFSAQSSGGINAVLDGLAANGWGFLANQAAWDYFLVHREGTFSVDPNQLKVGSLSLHKDVWEIGHWKSAVSFIEQKRSQINDRTEISSAELSMRFSVFCGLLALTIARQGFVNSDEDADRLVQTAAGFPASLGTPLECIKMRGNVTTSYLAQKYWPIFREIIAAEGAR